MVRPLLLRILGADWANSGSFFDESIWFERMAADGMSRIKRGNASVYAPLVTNHADIKTWAAGKGQRAIVQKCWALVNSTRCRVL